MGKVRNILTVDWDYFFPAELEWDWGHSEGHGPFLLQTLWTIRAASFLKRGLPLPGTSGLETPSFWQAFRFSPTARAFYGESHVHAANPLVTGFGKLGTTWNFDAHHDGGYRKSYSQTLASDRVSAEDWTLAHQISGADVHVFYPGWRDISHETEPTAVKLTRHTGPPQLSPVFHRVYIARSGAWVPPWLDAAFDAFVSACPVKPVRLIGPATLKRSFDREVAHQMAAQELEFEATFLQLARS